MFSSISDPIAQGSASGGALPPSSALFLASMLWGVAFLALGGILGLVGTIGG